MPRPPDALPGWLLAELEPVRRLAAALTDSPAEAADLVAEALARDPSWTQLPVGHDPAPLLRTGLVRTYLRGGRDPSRAAVALRDTERLTIGEIASLVDRPARRVATELAGASPGDREHGTGHPAGTPPSLAVIVDRYSAAVREVRREPARRRRLVAAGLLVGALVVIGVVVLPTLATRLLPPDVREPGEWRFSHRVELADGWSVEQRLLTPVTERTVIRLPITNGDPGSCTITLAERVEPVARRAETHHVRVQDHDATYVDDPALDPYVVWSYATERHAVVSCSRLVTPESLQLQVADAVVFDGEQLRTPFTLTARPAGYRVDLVSWTGPAAREVLVELAPDDVSAAPTIVVSSGRPEPADRCFPADGTVRTARTVVPRPDEICLTASWSTREPAAGRALDEVSGLLQRAADVTDPRTWFDADDLPG